MYQGQPQVNVAAMAQDIQTLAGMIRAQNEDLVRARKRLYAMEAKEAMREAGRTPSLPIEFKSQFGEDLMAYDLFEGRREGFFIEVGAFDGYNYSVTYALEAIGWKGLLVEAIPEAYEACRQRRVNSRVVNAALSRAGSTGTTTFTVTQDQYGGMLSYQDPNTQHARNVKDVPKREVTVPLTTMDELLKGHAGEVDLAVIDVEGMEISVLEGFDLFKHRPKVMFLEDNQLGRDPALGNYMQKHQYRFAGWLNVNRIYLRTDLADEFMRRMLLR